MIGAGVSVIMPAFNAASWIGQAIDSLLGQTVPPGEIVVIDDGSTDGTAGVVGKYGPKIHYVRRENQGVSTARNTGLQIARGEMIAFLDADDVWHPRKLELQLSVMSHRPEIGLLGTGLFSWPANAVPDGKCNDLNVAPIDRNQLAVRNYLATSSVLVRRELVRQVGEFDVTLCGPEDHDYWLRVAELSQIAILPMQLTGYRSVPASLSKRADAMDAGMWRILRKLDGRDGWRGNRLLRRRAYGYANFSSAYLHGADGAQGKAVLRLLGSFFWYPLPFRRSEAGISFARFRRMVVSLLRLFGLKRPDPVT